MSVENGALLCRLEGKAERKEGAVTHDAREIANVFIKLAQDNDQSLTNLKLQKLLYFAQARMLSIHDTRLIRQNVEAWPHGPVFAGVYNEACTYGDGPVSELCSSSSHIGVKTLNLVEAVFYRYSKYSAEELYELTHAEGTPWRVTVDSDSTATRRPIPDSEIINYHRPEWVEEAREISREMFNRPGMIERITAGFEEVEGGEYTVLKLDDIGPHA